MDKNFFLYIFYQNLKLERINFHLLILLFIKCGRFWAIAIFAFFDLTNNSNYQHLFKLTINLIIYYLIFLFNLNFFHFY